MCSYSTTVFGAILIGAVQHSSVRSHRAMRTEPGGTTSQWYAQARSPSVVVTTTRAKSSAAGVLDLVEQFEGLRQPRRIELDDRAGDRRGCGGIGQLGDGPAEPAVMILPGTAAGRCARANGARNGQRNRPGCSEP